MSYGSYPDLSNVKKILVIKLRQLGDVLLTGPVFKALKGHLPQAEIDAYVYQDSFPLLEGFPELNELIGYDRGWKKLPFFHRLKKEWALLRKIREGRYDLVINLTEGDRGAIAARWAQAPIRVGFEPKGRLQKGLYTHLVKICPALRHTVERNLDAVRKIGIFPEWGRRELFLPICEKGRQNIREMAGGEFILIHPTSRWRFKCWPPDKMRQLAIELLSRGKKVVFTSGPDLSEKEMVGEICAGLDILDLSGKISLKDLAAAIELSELLICADSLPFHMASALKKPVVAIFGPTSEVTWGPWRNPQARVVAQNWSCRPCYQDGCGGSKRSDCLATLPLKDVLRGVDDLLKAEVGT